MLENQITFNMDMSLRGPLIQAAANGDKDEIQRIINNYRNKIKHNDEVDAAHEAACNGHFDIARFFIKHRGVDVNSISYLGTNFLHDLCAVQSSSALKFCRELVEEKNFTSNVKDPQGKNPLHIACKSGNQGLVEYLSNRYHDMVEEKDKSESTPVFYAVNDRRKFGIVRFLVEVHDCHLRIADKEGKGPLVIAQNANACEEIVKYISDKIGERGY